MILSHSMPIVNTKEFVEARRKARQIQATADARVLAERAAAIKAGKTPSPARTSKEAIKAGRVATQQRERLASRLRISSKAAAKLLRRSKEEYGILSCWQ